MNLGVERTLVIQSIITDNEPKFWIVPCGLRVTVPNHRHWSPKLLCCCQNKLFNCRCGGEMKRVKRTGIPR